MLFTYFWLRWSSLLQGLFSGCGKWASHYGGSFCAERRCQGTWAQQLWLPGSRAQAQCLRTRPSSSTAYGIFLDQEMNSCLLFWQVDS